MTPWTAALQASLTFTISQNLLKLLSIELGMPSNHLVLCRPLLFLPSISSSIRVFSIESAHRIRWPKYWSFSFSSSPSSEYSGLISFYIDWFDFLAFQGTLKSLLQHHSSKTSIFWPSAFFMVQLSHSYMTTGKTTALIIWSEKDLRLTKKHLEQRDKQRLGCGSLNKELHRIYSPSVPMFTCKCATLSCQLFLFEVSI